MRLCIVLLACICTLHECSATFPEKDQPEVTLKSVAAQAFEDYLACIKPPLKARQRARCVQEFLLPACGVHERSSPPRPLPGLQASVQEGGKGMREGGGGGDEREGGHAADSIPHFPKLLVEPYAHRGALREYAKACQDGLGMPPHPQLALELFRLAAALGDPEAQGQMGVRFALGLQHPESWGPHGIAAFGEADENAATLHFYFGALGGDPLSRMALGYRHLHGVGVPKSCWSAVAYYQPIAEQVADLAASAQGSQLPQIERIRLSAQQSLTSKAERLREVVQYYQDSADKGNVDAQTAVGQVLNYGTHGMQRDHEAAMHYLHRASLAGDMEATGHLGHMHANGLGGGVDLASAYRYFSSAAQQNNPSAQYGLAYMHLTGQGAAEEHEKAYKLFVQAAEQGYPDAYFYMGMMNLRGMGMRRKSVQRAFSYLSLAAHVGHVQAMYNAAMLHLSGKGTLRNCKPASGLLKQAAEKSPTAAVLQEGHELFFRGHYHQALWKYLQAGEAGMELGMANAAWLMARSYAPAGGLQPNVTFRLHKRSAAQGNVASLLSMGDAYFYGNGVELDWGRSAAIYYEAYQERSAEAMFNLGYMHEFGAGVPQDLQLAHRFYAMAQHTTKDATLAVMCAHAWLAVHRAWQRVRPMLPEATGGFLGRLLMLQSPATAVAPRAMPYGGGAAVRLELNVWQWLDGLGITALVSALTDRGDVGETASLLLLCLALYLVLKLQRQRMARAAQRRRQEWRAEEREEERAVVSSDGDASS